MTREFTADERDGYLAPYDHLRRQLGGKPEDAAGKVVFAGDHRAVILGIHKGEFDLGAIEAGHCAASRFGIRGWVEDNGFDGFVEVEIFSNRYWAMDQNEFLDKIKDAYLKHT